MSVLYIGDYLGRRRTIMMGGVILCVGVVIQVTSFKNHSAFAQFIIGRIITGIGNGLNTSTIPTYQAECTHSAKRGLLICIEGGIIAFGSMIAYWIDYGSFYGNPSFSWRFPIAFQVVFGIFIVFGMMFLPESPRWLLSREHLEQGETVLAALQGKPPNHPDVQMQKALVMDSIRAAGLAARSTPIKAVFTNGKTQHFRRMMLGASSQFMQQIGGCNAVIYYLPILFESTMHKPRMEAMLLGGINMIVYAAFATCSWFVIERVGRRKLFIIGTIGQCLSMVITFACLIKKNDINSAKGAVFGIFLYIAFFGATWLPLPWLYPAEISPLKTRAKANALSTCSNWLFNFLIVMVTPVMISNIGWGTYLFFAAVNGLFLPVIIFFYPETAGRSLEEIDIIFAKGWTEKISYIRAAEQLPHLTAVEIKQMNSQYGFATESDSDGEKDEPRASTTEDLEKQ